MKDKGDKEGLLVVPEDWTDDIVSSASKRQDHDQQESAFLNEWLRTLAHPRWHSYKKVRVSRPGTNLWPTLARLRRKVLTLYHDAGLWTLFLAFGFLRWAPVRRGPAHRAEEIWESPLFLLPVDLEQESLTSPFLLKLREEEEPQFNLALRVYLEDVERVSLPEVDLKDFTKALGTIRGVALERGWSVDPVCWLALFSFHKMAIYQDLIDNEDRICRHRIVWALAGVTQADWNVSIPVDKATLDEKPSKELATVLPADSSQLEAVLRARQGESFVIHGPPGTGKSQTIVNIIADALIRGKSVLFVSEKRAALDVVLRRLREVRLEPFCLDLHDYKTSPGDVSRAIAEEMRRGRRLGSAPPDRLPAELDLKRKALADYARAIHTPRAPLNRTPYQVIGQVLRLPPALIPAPISLDMAGLTEDRLAEIMEPARNLTPLTYLAREGPAFPWWGIKVETFSEQLHSELIAEVRGLEHKLGSLVSAIRELCSPLGLRPPSTIDGASEVAQLLKNFQDLPPLPRAWMQAQRVQEWIARAEEARSALEDLAQAREKIASAVKSEFLSAEAESPVSERAVSDVQQAVAVLVSSDPLTMVADKPISSLLKSRHLFQELGSALDRAVAQADALREGLGLDRCVDLQDVRQAATLARVLVQGLRLEALWLQEWPSPEAIDQVTQFLDRLDKWKDVRQSLLREWTEEFLTLKASQAWDTWQRWGNSPLRYLSPTYRRLFKQLKGARRDGTLTRDRVTQGLQSLQELQGFQAALMDLMNKPLLSQYLGRYYAGFETDPETTKKALSLTHKIREAFPLGLPARVRRLLSGDEEINEKHQAIATDLLDAWTEWTVSLQQLGLEEAAILVPGKSLNALIQSLKDGGEALRRIADQWGSLALLLREQPSVTDLCPLLEGLRRFLQARARFQGLARDLATEWEWIPESTLTAWGHAISYLGVWAKVLSWAEGEGKAPAALVHAAQHPDDRPSPEPLDRALQEWEQALQSLKTRFHKSSPLIEGRNSFEKTEFPDLSRHLHRMAERAEEVRKYLDMQRFRKDLEGYLSPLVVDQLLADPNLPSLDKVVERLILSRWLDHVFDKDPVLKHFHWERHRQDQEEFQRLDKELERWAFSRTVKELDKKRESIIESRTDVKLIKKEAQKSRRHRPIRKLVGDAFHTIVLVKPCWLMSPLSVSRFLAPEHRFDLVIFDEASQVRPADAIPAIYRAKQAIVCGDPLQLPPTAFFEANVLGTVAEEESEENEAANYAAQGESVLELLDQTLPSVSLLWHYRSKDERLIAFSNRYLYHDKLITIPTPGAPDRDTGIEYKYVEGATYERAGRRVNQGEVEEVCRLVAEHLERWGTHRSLGVVTMNEPQKDAVLDELERRFRSSSLWDERKWPDGEPFFVKNLETVQGDERDVIIISTTYGKDREGRLTLQFGPLNQAGGERRLNVLVTRAREKVILVTSLQPEDISVPGGPQGAGLRMLRAYLTYARDKTFDTAKDHEGGATYESDFEASVADSLRSCGYEVIPQYGVGHYRIDLAVRDPSDPSRVQVAVECDGATYHRLPTVRERDRIREEWLRRLGWEVVRVWSTDWWYHPRAAGDRLIRAVEQALLQTRSAKVSTLQPPPAAPEGS